MFTTRANFKNYITEISKSSAENSSDLFRLEDEVEEAAEKAHHRERSADERADGGDELVPMLALPADHHRHGRDVVAEAGLGDIFLGVLSNTYM